MLKKSYFATYFATYLTEEGDDVCLVTTLQEKGLTNKNLVDDNTDPDVRPDGAFNVPKWCLTFRHLVIFPFLYFFFKMQLYNFYFLFF